MPFSFVERLMKNEHSEIKRIKVIAIIKSLSRLNSPPSHKNEMNFSIQANCLLVIAA
jgi:hypothetical protein